MPSALGVATTCGIYYLARDWRRDIPWRCRYSPTAYPLHSYHHVLTSREGTPDMDKTIPTDRGYAVISSNDDGTMTVKIATCIENDQPVGICAQHARAPAVRVDPAVRWPVPPHTNTRRRWRRCSLAGVPSLYEYRVRWRVEDPLPACATERG
jgi:hypothetical protein